MIQNEEYDRGSSRNITRNRRKSHTCCAITMDPDEVEVLIYKLREILENMKV